MLTYIWQQAEDNSSEVSLKKSQRETLTDPFLLTFSWEIDLVPFHYFDCMKMFLSVALACPNGSQSVPPVLEP